METQLMNDRVDTLMAAPFEDRRELFAELFRQVVSESGASLQDISHQTRISISFIEALLNAEFEVLPGEIFGRGFIRNVCKIIDVDPLPLVNGYDACLSANAGYNKEDKTARKMSDSNKSRANKQSTSITEKKDISEVAQKTASTVTDKPTNKTTKSTVPKSFGWLFPVLGVAAAVLVALWPTQNQEQHSSNLPFAVKAMKSAAVKRPAEKVEQVAVEKLSDTDPVEETGAVDQGVTGELSHNSFKAQSAGFEQVVEIKVLEPVKIKRSIDQGEAEVEELSQKTYRFVFDSEAEFLVYDASAVQITFNGRPIGHLGDKGRIRRISFAKKAEKPQTF